MTWLNYCLMQNLGSQMEYIMAKEHANRLNVISEIQDESKRKQLRMEDDEEDFLDESRIFL